MQAFGENVERTQQESRAREQQGPTIDDEHELASAPRSSATMRYSSGIHLIEARSTPDCTSI